MSEIDSKDYHDFVIKGGCFIGEFEQMYKKSAVIPWHQDEEACSIYSNLAIDMIKARAPYRQILDIGCGLGYFTHRLRHFGKVTGADISVTAVEKARENFPEIDFLPFDIRNKDGNLINKTGDLFDLIIIKEIIWYVIPQIDSVISNIGSMLQKKGYLLISNFFPRLDDAFYGKAVIPGPEALLNLFITANYRPIYYNILKRFEICDEGPLVTCLFQKV